ncbi:MAG: DUF739 family protein [Sphaerochaetaceae bacterium]
MPSLFRKRNKSFEIVNKFIDILHFMSYSLEKLKSNKEKWTMDYSKLRGKIREVYKTERAFADAMSLNNATLSQKLNGKRQWDVTEAVSACQLLGIAMTDFETYFFTQKV